MKQVPGKKRCIKDIKKRENCVIRICSAELAGYRYIEIRQYYKDKSDEYHPSKKGVTFSPELLDEIIEGLVEVRSQVSPKSK